MNSPLPFSRTILLKNETETAAFAARLASLCRIGDILALSGTLGMGKTALARAFIRALTDPCEDVPSPTFTLVQIYETERFLVYHFDLYRIEMPDDAFELGIDDAFAEGISLIEWPDRLGNILPARHLSLTLQAGETPEARRLVIEGSPVWGTRLQDML